MGAALPFIAVASAGMQVLGAIKGAQGAKLQAEAEANSARYNQGVALNNATIARQNASFAAAEGNAKVEQAELETRSKVGGIVANQAASGVDVNTGSAVDVRSSARELGELNAINLRADAARQAYGYQTEAAGYTGQAGLDAAEAKNDITAGKIQSDASLINGVGSAGSSFASFMQSGGLGSSSSSGPGAITWNGPASTGVNVEGP